MSEAFGDDFITITDEDGKEYELEVLASVEYNGATYLGVCPADQDETDEIEVSILKVTEEDGEEILVAVTDEDELQAVYDLLLQEEDEEDEDPEA
ncbi:MAG: DUF1292 domain-containing protein [Oscillospiraceae bacterium]|jgi:uncharacterized protein YrzB (UPF0473 family)|nr:DUF1292 domain-containing protein [Oscillospiraceae bacterium]